MAVALPAAGPVCSAPALPDGPCPVCPRLAKEFLKKLQEALQAEGFEAHRSPFGWYKTFTLTCIGHPLAEAYREY